MYLGRQGKDPFRIEKDLHRLYPDVQINVVLKEIPQPNKKKNILFSNVDENSNFCFCFSLPFWYWFSIFT